MTGFSWRIWGAAAVGLLVGVIIGITTDYFTDDTKPIVQKVAHASESGPAFTVLSGVSYGFISALPAMVGIAVSALVAYKLCDPMGEGYAIFGISMAAVGMLSIVGMIISNDAYGPIVDNARGLAEMGGLGEETHPHRRRAGQRRQHGEGRDQGLFHRRGGPDGHLPAGRLHERGQRGPGSRRARS